MRQWLQITSGRGPAECGWVVAQLTQRILEEAAKSVLEVQVLEAVPEDRPKTFKSVLLALDGPGAPAFIEPWIGTVQWVGTSPFRPHHKRRNWYVGVESLTPPDHPSWAPGEIKVETMRSSGPGGQHVNKSETAVRITHLPTGLSAIAREERSQYLNRKLALARLNLLLEKETARSIDQAQKARWDLHNALKRGDPVGVYEGLNFKPRRPDA